MTKERTMSVHLRGRAPRRHTLHRNITTFKEYIADQDPHIHQLLNDVDLSDTTARALSDMSYATQDLHTGTDSGLLNDVRTFGFIWGDLATRTNITKGKGHVTSEASNTSLAHTELCGIFASLTYLHLIMAYFHMVVPKNGMTCTVHCDIRAALQRVQNISYTGCGTTWRCRANYNLEKAIKFCLGDLPVRIHWEWVQGHASRRKQPHDFAWPDELNEEANTMVTEARLKSATSNKSHWLD